MENSAAPRGLIIDLITPLNHGAIDGAGLARLLDQVVPHAQALLLASPRHGEGESMEMAMRHELLKRVCDAVIDRPISLFMWISGNTETQTRKNILALQKKIEGNGGGGISRQTDFSGWTHRFCTIVTEAFPIIIESC